MLKKYLSKIIIHFFLFLLLSCAGDYSTKNYIHMNENPVIKITYIANTGFMVASKKNRILIDALFSDFFTDFLSPSRESLNTMIKGQTQFRDIKLLLITHSHADHFDLDLVSNFLNMHPETTLLSTSEIVNNINDKNNSNLSERLISMEDEANYQANGSVKIKGYILRHFPSHIKDKTSGKIYDQLKDYKNISFNISIDSINIIHVGDTDLDMNIEHFKIQKQKGLFTDIAFLPGGYVYSEHFFKLITEYIKPKLVILMHIPPKLNYEANTQIEKIRKTNTTLPEITFFKNSMESIYF